MSGLNKQNRFDHMELLQRLFPNQKYQVLDLVLQECNNDLKKAIEHFVNLNEILSRSSKADSDLNIPMPGQTANSVFMPSFLNQQQQNSSSSLLQPKQSFLQNSSVLVNGPQHLVPPSHSIINQAQSQLNNLLPNASLSLQHQQLLLNQRNPASNQSVYHYLPHLFDVGQAGSGPGRNQGTIDFITAAAHQFGPGFNPFAAVAAAAAAAASGNTSGSFYPNTPGTSSPSSLSSSLNSSVSWPNNVDNSPAKHNQSNKRKLNQSSSSSRSSSTSPPSLANSMPTIHYHSPISSHSPSNQVGQLNNGDNSSTSSVQCSPRNNLSDSPRISTSPKERS